MLVKLARNWFAPDASLRESRLNPHDVPDEWKDQLPLGAEILDEGGNVIEAASAEDKKLDELSATKADDSKSTKK